MDENTSNSIKTPIRFVGKTTVVGNSLYFKMPSDVVKFYNIGSDELYECNINKTVTEYDPSEEISTISCVYLAKRKTAIEIPAFIASYVDAHEGDVVEVKFRILRRA